MLRQSAHSLVRKGSNVRVETAFVTGSFFRTMEARPDAGRSFTEESLRYGDEHVAIISHALWQSEFGSDTHMIGKPIQLNRAQYMVIGIMPKDFGYPFNGDIPYVSFESKQTDIWLPWILSASEKTDRINFRSADAAIGRLRVGVTAATAQAELVAIESRLDALYADMWKGWTALARPLVQTIIGPVEKMLWLLLGAVGLVLLIAISNVASLLLARATGRAHELGVRAALGAERSRIIRQLLTEALLLSCVGGGLGVALAYAGVRILVALNPGDIPRFANATVDTSVLGVALILSVLTGVLAGLLPALAGSRFSINQLLRQGGNRVANAHKGRFAFIVFEVALSVVLLAGSGLLIRSYLQLSAVDPGFSPSTLTFGLNLDEYYSRPEQQTAFYRNFLAKLRTMPGVQNAGASNSIPLSNSESVSSVEVRGFGVAKEMVETRSVTVDYRNALGTLLLRGRDFNAHDLTARAQVVMVNESFVRAYFGGRDALGGQVRIGMGDRSQIPWSTVIGVLANIRHVKLEDAGQPEIFQPADSGNHFAIRCSAPVTQVMHEARGLLRSLDPALELESVHTMGERISEGNARRRFQTSLLTGFGAISLAFTLAGLYGLMAYTVKQRTAEIGVRLAVGAPRSRVLGLILVQGLRATGYGLVIGLAGALALTRLLSGWLFGVNAWDPATFIAVPLCVLAVTCGACLIPAWSATRIDPIRALRQE
jgi:predicted permease